MVDVAAESGLWLSMAKSGTRPPKNVMSGFRRTPHILRRKLDHPVVCAFEDQER